MTKFETGTEGGGHARPLDRRRAGVLLHLTSLPGIAQTGCMGGEARNFIDFLAAAGITVWQTLPVGPTQDDGSPYQTRSVHAGNPRLISLEPLLRRGWLADSARRPERLTDAAKARALQLAWEVFQQQATREERAALARFESEQGYWLDDYTLYDAIRREQGCCWWEWPTPLRDRDPQALAQARARLESGIGYLRFEQFLFFEQWIEMKRYANERGVQLFGDMPIFVAHDSAEVWAQPGLFDLLPDGMPRVVAGVPPDYFSETGQRWGNPLYRWDRVEQDGFRFWVERMRTQLALFDLVRIDHFRGFESYWEIPASEAFAINGRWVKAPGHALFRRLYEVFNGLPLVAEDLGIITPEVVELRQHFGLPGMKILQFAFSGGPSNPYLPYNHARDSVVYTGTHDNTTTVDWYQHLDEATRAYLIEFLGFPGEPMPWPLIRAALASKAYLAVIPMQDLLGLDGAHRMNTPGTTEGNWHWRFRWEQVPTDLAQRLRRQVGMYGRI